jgi:5-hydroxyisourate hydrolase
MAKISTHVLDTAHGKPAAGMALRLYFLQAGARKLVTQGVTNSEGRTDAPLISSDAIPTGVYELEFEAGAYFRSLATQPLPSPAFADTVVLRFGVADALGNYHVPLLVSPWSYSTYRGS